jgi:hypothetical protein
MGPRTSGSGRLGESGGVTASGMTQKEGGLPSSNTQTMSKSSFAWSIICSFLKVCIIFYQFERNVENETMECSNGGEMLILNLDIIHLFQRKTHIASFQQKIWLLYYIIVFGYKV